MLLPTTIQVPSAKSAITTAASLAASAVLLRSIAGDLVPHEIQHLFLSKLRALLASFSPEVTLVIEEFHGFGLNHLFAAAETYLGTKLSPSTSTQRFRASLAPNDHNVSVSLDRNDAIVDNFKGIPLKWRLVSKQIPTKFVSNPSDYSCNAYSEIRYFELNFHKKHRDTILNAYLRHITEESKAAKEEKKTLKLFTLKYDRMRPRRGSPWQSVNLDHPATFETVAMEAEMKRKVVEDLERFVRRKDYYRKVGKAWKRGYMLFGPPGTGKSSLVAAMANYLNFDVYDLELTDLRCNSDLRRLLISTANRSILVVEDIDCSIEFHNRREKEKDLNPFRRSNRGSQAQSDTIRAAKFHRRAVVELRRRADYSVHDEPQGEARPGFAAPGPHGRARPHVLLHPLGLQNAGLQLPWHHRPPLLLPPPAPDADQEGESCRGRGAADEER
ncbi:protein HYPER-SENSITIVITY-RELATED 4-like isoform X2 [Malania oleifera]|uniref:protein HYPER-SENSITIVITY-RELATED 4-like isoform X2 n=1 Tax=Malania oleifera TaxID=397392 RepID=UPI0025AE75F7|nr:protein HYPER-SENSITIVITY-RELATED 4-like isoform X2 [Malania oleifera]